MAVHRLEAAAVNRRSASLVPALCLAGAVLFWGTSFVAIKTALDSFSPMTVIWLRMMIATAVFAPFWPKVAKPEYRKGDWKLLTLNAVLMPCMYYALEGYAVLYTTSSQAGVISAIVPLLVAAGAWLLLKERIGGRAAAATSSSSSPWWRPRGRSSSSSTSAPATDRGC
jgi:drug/metabolite transporter (DMT)-like permease